MSRVLALVRRWLNLRGKQRMVEDRVPTSTTPAYCRAVTDDRVLLNADAVIVSVVCHCVFENQRR